MKRGIIISSFIFFAAICYGQSGYTPIASRYPGSVEAGGSSVGVYYTKDSYNNVRAFYFNEKGQPKSETTGDNNDKHAYFVYYKSPPLIKMDEYTLGVNINTNSGNERAVDYVFERLQEGVMKQLITQAEFDELKNSYAYLKGMYFLYDDAAKTTVAMAIYRKYEKKIKENIEGQGRNLEDMSMQAQKLMAEGKMQELAELMKQMHSATGDLATDMTSGEEYEEWKKCLAEIERNAFKTRIRIDDASNI